MKKENRWLFVCFSDNRYINYEININVKKGDKKQDEAGKAFEVIRYIKEKNYLPLYVDVNYEVEDGEITHFSMKDIDQISSANDILALMN